MDNLRNIVIKFELNRKPKNRRPLSTYCTYRLPPYKPDPIKPTQSAYNKIRIKEACKWQAIVKHFTDINNKQRQLLKDVFSKLKTIETKQKASKVVISPKPIILIDRKINRKKAVFILNKVFPTVYII